MTTMEIVVLLSLVVGMALIVGAVVARRFP
jgi:hypothetical protein